MILVISEGQTPEKTMSAAISYDIRNRKLQQLKPRFKRPGQGLIGLTEWDESSELLTLEERISKLISKQNKIQKENMLKKLQEMNPYKFEELISELLQSMGYSDVQVTARSRDRLLFINKLNFSTSSFQKINCSIRKSTIHSRVRKRGLTLFRKSRRARHSFYKITF